MSDTPRTDAEEFVETNKANALVMANFARTLERENNQLRATLAEAESSLSAIRAECLRLSRENLELRRGALLERVISPNDSRVTEYTD